MELPLVSHHWFISWSSHPASFCQSFQGTAPKNHEEFWVHATILFRTRLFFLLLFFCSSGACAWFWLLWFRQSRTVLPLNSGNVVPGSTWTAPGAGNGGILSASFSFLPPQTGCFGKKNLPWCLGKQTLIFLKLFSTIISCFAHSSVRILKNIDILKTQHFFPASSLLISRGDTSDVNDFRMILMVRLDNL